MRELILRAQNGDKAAEDRLIKENSRLVWSIVMRFLNRGCEKDDLFQIGAIGLIKAVKRFDTTLGLQFSTYAVPLIIGEIRLFLRDDGIIKVSRTIKETSAKLLSAKEGFEKKNGREPTVNELAAITGISPEQIMQASDAPYRVESLNALVGDGTAERADLRPDEKTSGESIAESLALKMAIENLDEREQKIVKLRYYMDKTQVQTAKILGISQVQVSRLEKKLLRKITREIG
ncbi:MAG: SigB/SigF/SigG family RNA polymerase sigma factor [Firmicutes bacterium]|nr:SigB/SigF/SigG family RNA polymerase sigma factor [Bacillota bacterium]